MLAIINTIPSFVKLSRHKTQPRFIILPGAKVYRLHHINGESLGYEIIVLAMENPDWYINERTGLLNSSNTSDGNRRSHLVGIACRVTPRPGSTKTDTGNVIVSYCLCDQRKKV